MEDALALAKKSSNPTFSERLNPCFNGRCTRTNLKRLRIGMPRIVLILVLMEDALAHTDAIAQAQAHNES